MNSILKIGCNYHTTWQTDKAMRFVLIGVEGAKAKLCTRTTKKNFWTNLEDLIFIDTDTNKKKLLDENNPYATIKWSGGESWSNATKSWYVCISEGLNGSWSSGYWFPKSMCHLDAEKGTLTVPKWLLKKHKIEDVVTYV